jgi:AbrB family looped-hinge helix DNA binding protein
MRVTVKGQVTIPKEIRDRLQIVAGSEVDFVERPGGTVELVRTSDDEKTMAALRNDIADWLGRISGSGDSGLSSDDVMAMTRDRNGRDDR